MTAISPLAPTRFPDLPPIPGVLLAAAEARLRYRGRPDLLLASLALGTAVAGVLTRSLTATPPVHWCRALLPSPPRRTARRPGYGCAASWRGRRRSGRPEHGDPRSARSRAAIAPPAPAGCGWACWKRRCPEPAPGTSRLPGARTAGQRALSTAAFSTEGLDGQAPVSGATLSWQQAGVPVGLRGGWVAERAALLGGRAAGAFGRMAAGSAFAGIEGSARIGA